MRSQRVPILLAALLLASCRHAAPESSRTRPNDAAPADCTGGVIEVGANGRYARITDALRDARNLRLRAGTLERAADVICIDVAPGRYVGTFDPETLAANSDYEAFPLLVDAPGIAIRGSTRLVIDEFDRPVRVEADATTLIAYPAATDGTQDYILVTSTERAAGESRIRSHGNDARIEGLVLRFAACSATGRACGASADCREESCASTRRGTGIWAHFVQDYTLRSNAVSGAGSFALAQSFASGRTIGNLLTHNAPAGISHRGPTPGRSLVRENTSTDNAAGGMVAVCAAGNFAMPVLPHERDLRVVPGPVDGSLEHTEIEISGNDFSRHAADSNFSFGLRVMAFSVEPFPARRSRCSVTVASNRIRDTSFGIVTDAGFPYRRRDGVPVDAAWTAELEGRYENNDVQGHTEDVLVSLTRFTSTRDCRELDASRTESFGFLRNSSYVIDGALASVCYDNRELDPATGQRLGNELRIAGRARTGLTCAQVRACD